MAALRRALAWFQRAAEVGGRAVLGQATWLLPEVDRIDEAIAWFQLAADK